MTKYFLLIFWGLASTLTGALWSRVIFYMTLVIDLVLLFSSTRICTVLIFVSKFLHVFEVSFKVKSVQCVSEIVRFGFGSWLLKKKIACMNFHHAQCALRWWMEVVPEMRILLIYVSYKKNVEKLDVVLWNADPRVKMQAKVRLQKIL